MVPPAKTITLPSRFRAAETFARLERAVIDQGLWVFAKLDFTADAAEVNLDLGPTFAILIGNPRMGTQLLLENQLAALELPLKILVWTNARGETWIAYDDPLHISQRHAVDVTGEKAITKMQRVLTRVTQMAAGDIEWSEIETR
ncbi:DUF302 domain-containing protein [Rhizobium mesosinicum]|uniref:DUF302 domain-containing protein n=1 Tax=Rhizobium mesosinicum TaxID=335017 RepID=A0ABS7GM78_9HYPH|nr:DUF302 domain-containing protein [Rhizobium mesosinicum]MBW9051081.1 DUF302 domain-containing protein [Rhizobium mesosinicum]